MSTLQFSFYIMPDYNHGIFNGDGLFEPDKLMEIYGSNDADKSIMSLVTYFSGPIK